MAKDRTLKAAFDRFKGVDYKLLHQKKLQRQAEKRKLKQQRSQINVDALETAHTNEDNNGESQEQINGSTAGDETEAAAAGEPRATTKNGSAGDVDMKGSEDEDEEEEQDGGVTLSAFDDESDSDSDDEVTFSTAAVERSPNKPKVNGHQNQEEDAEDGEDIPLSDIESLASEERGDVIPHQRLTINNTAALMRSLKSFALPVGLPFSATQAVTSAEPVAIADVEDDLTREQAFYRQSLDAVKEARIQLKKEGVPFSRPADYFAEMVKSEEQMGKVRQKMVDEAARKKASADARRQRDLKKFGKAVQVAKLQERDRAKRETMDKINSLKRKRQGGAGLTANEDDMFDVALEDAAETERKDRAARRVSGAGSNKKRQKKDEKFGFGGKKRFAKSNDAVSSADMSGYSARKMKSGGKAKTKQRPGKSRRAKNS